MDRRIRYLDGWRGLAILAVLCGHFIVVPGLDFGRFGVELFFVLSGRLMAEILFVERKPLPDFFLRRFARIYPGLLMFATVALVASSFKPDASMGLAHYLATVTLTFNYLRMWIGSSGIINHVWSLCVEEHLYILLALLAALHRIRPYPVAPALGGIAALCAVNGLVSTLLGYGYYEVYWRSDVRGASILMGAAAYLWFGDKRSPAWAPLLLAALGIAFNVDVVPDPLKYTLGTACLASTIALLPNLAPLVLGALQGRPLLWFGMVSYSVYLWQEPFFWASEKFGYGFLFAPVAVLAGYGSYRMVEQPARRWINDFFRPPSTAKAGDTPAR